MKCDFIQPYAASAWGSKAACEKFNFNNFWINFKGEITPKIVKLGSMGYPGVPWGAPGYPGVPQGGAWGLQKIPPEAPGWAPGQGNIF